MSRRVVSLFLLTAALGLGTRQSLGEPAFGNQPEGQDGLSAKAADLSPIRLYPNPYRPAIGHTSVTLDRVATGSRVQIFTLLGERLFDEQAPANGIVRWDVRNPSGWPVASGIYFILIENAGTRRRLKLAVKR